MPAFTKSPDIQTYSMRSWRLSHLDESIPSLINVSYRMNDAWSGLRVCLNFFYFVKSCPDKIL
jgi:hypothetical protein